MDLLDAVLERYEFTVGPRTAEEQQEDELAAFMDKFYACQEVLLRRLLDEAAWRLEQRGHHAWLHEETTDGLEHAERDAISLLLIPIGYVAGEADPSSVTFIADAERGTVVVREHIGGTAHQEVRVGTYTIDQLDEESVAAIATELVRRAFAAYPPLSSDESRDPSIARE